MYKNISSTCWYFENSQKFLVTFVRRICVQFSNITYYLLIVLQRFCDFYYLLLVDTRTTQKPQYYLHLYCQIVKRIFNKCFYFVKCQKSAVFFLNLPRKNLDYYVNKNKKNHSKNKNKPGRRPKRKISIYIFYIFFQNAKVYSGGKCFLNFANHIHI